MADLQAAHPQEVFIAGQVCHGGTTNHTGQTRRVYHCAYTARANPPQTDRRACLRAETEAHMSPAAGYILDG